MSIENLYSYLEYLAISIDKLESSIADQENLSAEYVAQLNAAQHVINNANAEIDRLNAQLQINSAQYDAQIKKLEQHIQLQVDALKQAEQQLEKAAKEAKKQQNKQQDDLFGGWAQPAPTKIAPKIANDQNAILLAQKLDSTIDKVQRLIGQGK